MTPDGARTASAAGRAAPAGAHGEPAIRHGVEAARTKLQDPDAIMMPHRAVPRSRERGSRP